MRGNPNPRNYCVGAFISISVFLAMSLINREAMFLGTGALVLVNYLHLTGIHNIKKNWNNKKLWKVLRMFRKCFKN